MKRLIATLVCGTVMTMALAQQKPADFKMSVAEYQKAATIRDLIKTLPADCKVLQYEVSTPIKGSLRAESHLGDEVKWDRIKAEPGEKVFITIFSSTCKKKMKSEYKIVLE